MVRRGVADAKRDETVSLDEAYHDWMRAARNRERGIRSHVFEGLMRTALPVAPAAVIGSLMAKFARSKSNRALGSRSESVATPGYLKPELTFREEESEAAEESSRSSRQNR